MGNNSKKPDNVISINQDQIKEFPGRLSGAGSNYSMDRIMLEKKCCKRGGVNFPDVESALMLVAARLRHISATKWGSHRYLNMDLLKEFEEEIKVG